ncbi:hypothetical protein BDR03DRAFT_934965 [Suillus americanus]|nr:hypothetical protein BDR03DRAFT_934965 [Suillus americanus]
MKQDDFEVMQEHSIYYPFADRAEWELAKFLCDNFNQGQITQFLKLLWVVSEMRKPLSFKNAKQLFTFMDALLVTPRWKCTPIHTDGYTTTHPMNLIWRDALEVVHHIFGNPIFANHMEYNPYKINDNGEHEYGEWMSCEQASEIQDQLPVGATIVPIILTSDKMPVTRQTGSLEMHPTFLTIGNIHSEIRMKATLHAWACIVYIPVPKYVVNSEFSGLLEACIWHKCMDLVLQNLKVAAGVGEFMVDPMGCQCYAFTPLAAHIADLPEQTMIACVSKNASPTTLATQAQFSGGITYPPRCGSDTLQKLHKLCKSTDPWKVWEFQELAKQHFLKGVHQPYWCNWGHADPSIFLILEILHVCHKFFFNHPLKWCKEVIGPSELDARFRSQHKRVGTRHFHDGVSLNTCPHYCGCESDGFAHAIHALIDFIYKAQAPTFTRSSIDSMHFILEAEARMGTSGPISHFQIPKLESFNLFTHSIQQSGALIQHSADQIVNIINRISLINVMDDNWIAHVAPQEMHCFQAIRPANAAFHVTIAHDLADRSAATLTQHYRLADFPNVLSQYLNAWYKFRLQLHSQLCPCNIMPSQQVQAYPPCDAYPFGNCDIVLLQPTDAHPKSLPCVIQVRMVFVLSPRGSQLPAELKEPLLYVQQFKITAPPEAEPHIAMYQVRHSFYPASDGSSSHTRIGKIVRLIDVTHAVELIPIYGTMMDCSVSSTTSLERYDNFYLNAFSNKEWYHTLHADFV